MHGSYYQVNFASDILQHRLVPTHPCLICLDFCVQPFVFLKSFLPLYIFLVSSKIMRIYKFKFEAQSDQVIFIVV